METITALLENIDFEKIISTVTDFLATINFQEILDQIIAAIMGLIS